MTFCTENYIINKVILEKISWKSLWKQVEFLCKSVTVKARYIRFSEGVEVLSAATGYFHDIV
ncbi:hypothetical protein B5G00_14680 [Blautia sp. An46]|nr:hypothetical protein B5G33_17070 [Blautia sp. An81]OUN90749.1 hypothetical protein B5G00_14680 [Blautia sp. An46]